VTRDPARDPENQVDQLRRELRESSRAQELFASLYVQLDRLHLSLKLPDVVTAIHEALVNLVGTEDFALYARDDASGRFELLAAMGSGQHPASFSVGEGPLGEAAATRVVSWGDPLAAAPLLDDEGACVGMLTISSLLRHRGPLENRDRMLVEALGAHAGVALKAALCAAAAPPRWSVAQMRQKLGATR
jgi:hypothetical protein